LKLNITAIMTPDQVRQVAEALKPDVPLIVSVFAGRIADSGRDPLPIMKQSLLIFGPDIKITPPPGLMILKPMITLVTMLTKSNSTKTPKKI